MKTVEEYLDEIADMVLGTDPRLALTADFGEDVASLRVHGPGGTCLGEVRISVPGDAPEFDMEHACFNAGCLAGMARVHMQLAETLQ